MPFADRRHCRCRGGRPTDPAGAPLLCLPVACGLDVYSDICMGTKRAAGALKLTLTCRRPAAAACCRRSLCQSSSSSRAPARTTHEVRCGRSARRGAGARTAEGLGPTRRCIVVGLWRTSTGMPAAPPMHVVWWFAAAAAATSADTSAGSRFCFQSTVRVASRIRETNIYRSCPTSFKSAVSAAQYALPAKYR